MGCKKQGHWVKRRGHGHKLTRVFKTRIVGASRLIEWTVSPNESLKLKQYIFCKIWVAYIYDCSFKKTWPHCDGYCHFRLLEWAHGLATFFSSFFARKDSYTKCKKIATRILLSQFVFAFCILISSRLPQWVEIFTEGALFFRLWPLRTQKHFFLVFNSPKKQ